MVYMHKRVIIYFTNHHCMVQTWGLPSTAQTAPQRHTPGDRGLGGGSPTWRAPSGLGSCGGRRLNYVSLGVSVV